MNWCSNKLWWRASYSYLNLGMVSLWCQESGDGVFIKTVNIITATIRHEVHQAMQCSTVRAAGGEEQEIGTTAKQEQHRTMPDMFNQKEAPFAYILGKGFVFAGGTL